MDWFKCMKVDVACLQETHAPSRWFANSVLDNDRDRLHHASYTGAAALRAQESGLALQSFCPIPRLILCGAHYIQRKQLILGHMHLVRLHCALIWSGPPLV